MENKLNNQAIENYSIQLTKKLSDDFFAKNLTISGHQILSYTPIEQVNLYIISNLFEKWKEETSKLKSPFFDYDHQDVKQAMRTFMNVLSKHIAIRRADFDPLMRKAVCQSLHLTLAPYLFIKENYFSLDYPIVQIAELKEKIKYIKINKQITDSFIKKTDKHNLTSTPLSYALDYLNEAYKEVAHELVDPLPIIDIFNNLEPVKFENLVIQSKIPVSIPQESQPSSLAANINHMIKVEEIKEVQESYQKEEVEKEPEVKIEEPITIPLVEKVSEPKVKTDITKSININQRFMFVNGLFKGEAKVFQEALEKINQSNSAKEAIETLIDNYADKFKWNLEQDEILEFFDFVSKRF